jgi:hypothetical protein
MWLYAKSSLWARANSMALAMRGVSGIDTPARMREGTVLLVAAMVGGGWGGGGGMVVVDLIVGTRQTGGECEGMEIIRDVCVTQQGDHFISMGEGKRLLGD